MSQAETLLNSMAEHSHTLVDTDTYFVIDPETRTITNDTRRDIVLIQRDHNSAVFTFQLPRYIDGHDMTLCNRVYVHFNNIDGETGEENADLAEMTDLRVDPNNSDMVISSWTITRQATQLVGILSFLVQYKCVEDGVDVYEFHTDFFSDVQIKKGRNNSEAAVIEYTNILEQWYQRIFGTGESVITNIIETSNEQQALLEQTAETQKESIESKGNEVLASIPEDYATTYNMADSSLRTKANATTVTEEGEAFVATDCSDDNLRGLRLFGKSTQITTTGKNLIDVKNDSLIVVGSTGNKRYGIVVDTPGTYTFSCIASPETSIAYKIITDGIYGEYTTCVGNIDFTVTIEENQSLIIYKGAEGDRFRNYLSNVQLELGTVATEYEPYSGGKASPTPEYPQEVVNVNNPTVNVCGVNLIPYPYYEQSATKSGVSFTVNEDGSMTLNGAPTAATSFIISHYTQKNIYVKRGQKYFFRALTSESKLSTIYAYISYNGGSPAYDVGHGTSITPTEDGWATVCVVVAAAAGTLDNLVIKPQLELWYETEDYEPYNGQSFTLNRTLNGVPVSSGGNYTDSEGQQWICDEVDFERGIYVQRIKKVILDADPSILYKKNDDDSYLYYAMTADNLVNVPCLCDKLLHKKQDEMKTNDIQAIGVNGANSYRVIYINLGYLMTENTLDEFKRVLAENPLTVYYALDTPIETPLTSDELLAFRELHSNYPVTTVVNNENAYMSLTYNADTKTWIKNLVSSMIAE